MELKKSIQIPILENRKFSIQNDGDVVHIWYAVNNDNNLYEEVDIIKDKANEYPEMKSFLHYDFRVGTHLGSKRWFVWDTVNIFENTNSTPRTTLIKDNNKSFERIYWMSLKAE